MIMSFPGINAVCACLYIGKAWFQTFEGEWLVTVEVTCKLHNLCALELSSSRLSSPPDTKAWWMLHFKY
jgi:hypothetical protein